LQTNGDLLLLLALVFKSRVLIPCFVIFDTLSASEANVLMTAGYRFVENDLLAQVFLGKTWASKQNKCSSGRGRDGSITVSNRFFFYFNMFHFLKKRRKTMEYSARLLKTGN